MGIMTLDSFFEEETPPISLYNPPIPLSTGQIDLPSCLETIEGPYHSAGNNSLNLSPVRTHKDSKLVDNTPQHPKPVILGQSLQKVFDGLVARLRDHADDGGLIGGAQGWRRDNPNKLGIAVEGPLESSERLVGRFEGRLFYCCDILGGGC